MLTLLGALLVSAGACCTGSHSDRASAGVKVTPIAGQLGYALAGPHGFKGTIAKADADAKEWTLSAKFVFPSAGYTVGKPVILVQKSLPEKVFVTFSVTPPALDAVVAQVITEVPVNETIRVSNKATFVVTIK